MTTGPACYTGRVPRVAPFHGLVYDPTVVGPLDLLTAPPYDVISGPNREGLRARSPYNIVHVDLADEGENQPPGEHYRRAASLLRRWRASGAVVRSEEPCFYAYEVRFALDGSDRRVRGILCALELEPWGGAILPHEQTMEGPIDDRLRLLRATRTHLSPIYGTIAGPSEPLSMLLDAVTATAPAATVADEEGVEHRVWSVDGRTDVTAWLAPFPLLIADGHHRYATALAYREERREAAGAGPWDRVLALVVDAATEAVPVLPYHRVQVAGRPPSGGRPIADLPALLASLDDVALRYGTVTREDGRVVYRTHELTGDPPTVRALHDQVLDVAAPGDALRFTHDAADADGAVRQELAVAAYLLPPTTADRVRKVVERGERLPRKSTFFWPKPRTGMVMMAVG
jgi:uncharacterized protein (DUF1015 family)